MLATWSHWNHSIIRLLRPVQKNQEQKLALEKRIGKGTSDENVLHVCMVPVVYGTATHTKMRRAIVVHVVFWLGSNAVPIVPVLTATL